MTASSPFIFLTSIFNIPSLLYRKFSLISQPHFLFHGKPNISRSTAKYIPSKWFIPTF